MPDQSINTETDSIGIFLGPPTRHTWQPWMDPACRALVAAGFTPVRNTRHETLAVYGDNGRRGTTLIYRLKESSIPGLAWSRHLYRKSVHPTELEFLVDYLVTRAQTQQAAIRNATETDHA
jgi:hypothetical protein